LIVSMFMFIFLSVQQNYCFFQRKITNYKFQEIEFLPKPKSKLQSVARTQNLTAQKNIGENNTNEYSKIFTGDSIENFTESSSWEITYDVPSRTSLCYFF
jgi:hypothetical protein